MSDGWPLSSWRSCRHVECVPTHPYPSKAQLWVTRSGQEGPPSPRPAYYPAGILSLGNDCVSSSPWIVTSSTIKGTLPSSLWSCATQIVISEGVIICNGLSMRYMASSAATIHCSNSADRGGRREAQLCYSDVCTAHINCYRGRHHGRHIAAPAHLPLPHYSSWRNIA